MWCMITFTYTTFRLEARGCSSQKKSSSSSANTSVPSGGSRLRGPGRHQAQGSRSPAAQAATDSGQATPRGPRARHPWGHHPHRSAAPRVRSPRGRVASLSCTAVRLPCRCAPTKRSYPTPLHAHAKHTVSARPTRPTSHLIEESACTTGLERKQKALRHRAASFARHLVRRPWHEWHEWLRSHVNVLSDSQRPP